MLTDFLLALRQLRKSPGFAATAILTIALGIGANTAIFSVINQVLLHQLPYREPDRLVMAWERDASRGASMNVVSPANFLDWREQNTGFERMAAFNDRVYTLTGSGEPEEFSAMGVNAAFFPMLGAQAMLGRVYTTEDEKPENPLLVILSHGLWQRRFGGDPSVIGRTIMLNGSASNIVGVMPPDFRFFVKEASYNNKPPEMWVQVRFSAASRVRGGRFMGALAQLKPGISVEQARAEMATIAARLAKQYPDFNSKWDVNLVPLKQQLTGEIRPALLVLFGAVAFILLIACANVANLLLARAAGREREIAVRSALGASRGSIIRLLLIESLVLALLGGALGLLGAKWGVTALPSLLPPNLLGVEQVDLDYPVLAFTLGATLLTGLAFGLVPALTVSRPELQSAMKDGSRGVTTSGSHRLRAAFVSVQIALALVVLVGAGLLGRSFVRLLSSDLGFNPKSLLAVGVNLPPKDYADEGKVVRFYQQLLTRVSGLPGVTAVSANAFAPFTNQGAATGFEIVGQPKPPAGRAPVTDVRLVDANYFSTLGIPLLAGRTFNAEESEKSRHVVLINETLARKHFPGQNPIGQKLTIFMKDGDPASEVIGVVGDIRHETLATPPREMVYWPIAEMPLTGMTLMVRTANDPLSLVDAVRREVRALDPKVPLADVTTMERMIAGTAARARFATLLFGIFAALAVVLSTIGIYGVIAYNVAQRTREIGIRMALGARAGTVVGEVLRHGLLPAGCGLALGLGISLALTRLLSSLLYGVTATDPGTFAAVSLGVAAIALLATWLPARRAAKVDPMVALRAE